jgi:hypothetical protein
MYLNKITLKNIKCFSHLKMDFSDGKDVRRWTTLFGNNGLGKSTLLQAIGAALAGPSALRELLPVAEGWVRQGQPYGEIEAELSWTRDDALAVGRSRKTTYISRFIVTGDPEKLPPGLDESYYSAPTVIPWRGIDQVQKAAQDMKQLLKTAYAEDKQGWLGCGYGPFRRLSGGTEEAGKVLYARRRSARFVTLFREDAALTNVTGWLIELHNVARERNQEGERALQIVRDALANNLFPEPIGLDLSANQALLQVGDHKPIPFRDLSDGYRSMLALSVDLLRWLIQAFPNEEKPMKCSGVVLIDELDVHLHPKWQRTIGHWLHEKFPNIQFIVATHSPFLAPVADEDKPSSIEASLDEYLSKGNIVLKETLEGVQAHSDYGSVKDLRADQILRTPLFDMESLYSPKTEAKLHRHQELHLKEQSGQLSDLEKQDHEQLEMWRENLPLLSDPGERSQEEKLKKAIQSHSDELARLS